MKCVKNETEQGGEIRLEPVTSGSAENEQFYKYTPGGSVTLTVLNPPAAEFFEEGCEYYVDFSAAAVDAKAAGE